MSESELLSVRERFLLCLCYFLLYLLALAHTNIVLAGYTAIAKIIP